MVNLSTTEKKVFNNVSRIHEYNVNLGDRIQEIINSILISIPAKMPEGGTPVNAVNATAILNVIGVVIHGETVTIGTDVYEFLSDAAQTKSAPANIAVNIAAQTTASTGTLTMDTQPTAGDKVTIGEKVYTFVPVGTDTADGEVSIGSNVAEAQLALVAAINGTDGINTPHPLVTAGDFANDACTITALIGGTIGDDIATTETFTAATNGFAAVELGSGADCTAANAITALVAAITASDTQGVGAADGTGDTVALTADVAGVAGNEIALAKSMVNGAFANAATSLAGGVDGTVGAALKVLIDASYLYICLANNTISGKNWRRVSLGSAY
jgi:hypothetical protein